MTPFKPFNTIFPRRPAAEYASREKPMNNKHLHDKTAASSILDLSENSALMGGQFAPIKSFFELEIKLEKQSSKQSRPREQAQSILKKPGLVQNRSSRSGLNQTVTTNLPKKLYCKSANFE